MVFLSVVKLIIKINYYTGFFWVIDIYFYFDFKLEGCRLSRVS